MISCANVHPRELSNAMKEIHLESHNNSFLPYFLNNDGLFCHRNYWQNVGTLVSVLQGQCCKNDSDWYTTYFPTIREKGMQEGPMDFLPFDKK
jgi:hypothetical protein